MLTNIHTREIYFSELPNHILESITAFEERHNDFDCRDLMLNADELKLVRLILNEPPSLMHLIELGKIRKARAEVVRLARERLHWPWKKIRTAMKQAKIAVNAI